jgi:Domain of unknown function (DUF4386)
VVSGKCTAERSGRRALTFITLARRSSYSPARAIVVFTSSDVRQFGDPSHNQISAKDRAMNMQQTQRLAAAAMAGAATLAIAGFTALGSIFDYPKILKEPTEEILASYRENQSAITGWFLALVVSAALLAPVGFLLGRIAGGRIGRWITGVGIAAATVQVIGLSRWVLLIPGVSDDATVPALTADAHHTFELLHFWLGTILGETIGYALTATFTVLVVVAMTGNGAVNHTIVTRWIGYLGYASAALIATGVLIPLGLSGASITNFVGYVAWCLWLIAMAVILWRSRPAAGTPAGAGSIAGRKAADRNAHTAT